LVIKTENIIIIIKISCFCFYSPLSTDQHPPIIPLLIQAEGFPVSFPCLKTGLLIFSGPLTLGAPLIGAAL